jgi:hypothetical protein
LLLLFILQCWGSNPGPCMLGQWSIIEHYLILPADLIIFDCILVMFLEICISSGSSRGTEPIDTYKI